MTESWQISSSSSSSSIYYVPGDVPHVLHVSAWLIFIKPFQVNSVLGSGVDEETGTRSNLSSSHSLTRGRVKIRTQGSLALVSGHFVIHCWGHTAGRWRSQESQARWSASRVQKFCASWIQPTVFQYSALGLSKPHITGCLMIKSTLRSAVLHAKERAKPGSR